MPPQQSISVQYHYIPYFFRNALTQQPNDSAKDDDDDDDDDDDATSLSGQSSSRLCAASGAENAIISVKLLFLMF